VTGADPVLPLALPLTFSPWRLGALELPHRVVTGSMHTGLETLDDGGTALAAFYAERVRGGAALIVTGGLAVNAEGCGAEDFSVLGDPAGDARFERAVAAVHREGGRIAAQLFHAGRYALLAGVTDADGRPVHPVAPSPIAWRSAGASVPVELDEEGIARTIADFGRAAARAVELGFDAVEIMASEGYLINQFCSPVTNRRDDDWGGDAVRRQRFAVEVLRSVRRAVGFDVPVIVRLSGADLVPDSTTPAETGALARALVRAGADALNVGIGWHESRVPTVQAAVPHGVWLGYAEAVAAAIALPGDPASPTAVPVIASNRLTDLRDVEEVLSSTGGRITAVALARPFLADAAIVNRSRDGMFAAVNTCIGCNQACLDRSFTMQPVSCLVNPRAANEWRYPLPVRVLGAVPVPLPAGSVPAGSVPVGSVPARVAVVGGGPAGLVAAADLAERGHDVTLFEAAAELGGQFRLAAHIPTKEDYALTIEHYAARLAQLGAEVRLRHAVSAAELAAGRYSFVVLATGVRPRALELEGADLPHVQSYEDAIVRGVPAGRVAIVGGGGIGVDVAKLLVLSPDAAVRAAEFESRYGLLRPSTALESPSLPQRVPALGGRRAVRAGSDVTLLRRTGKFGAGMGITSRWVALGELRSAGVRFVSDLEYERIMPHGVEVRYADGLRELIPADTVIVCAGQVSHDPLSAALAARGIPHERVGGALDADRVDAVRATRQALDAARRAAA
jgi:2,4-dienoyl-CoA reductase (NADPH2)